MKIEYPKALYKTVTDMVTVQSKEEELEAREKEYTDYADLFPKKEIKIAEDVNDDNIEALEVVTLTDAEKFEKATGESAIVAKGRYAGKESKAFKKWVKDGNS